MANSNPRICTTYDIVTEASAEQGDVEESGWYDEEGVEFPCDDPDEPCVEEAAKWLSRKGIAEASSSRFHLGVWYCGSPELDYRTGEDTTYYFHLKGFTENEEAQIYGLLFPERARRNPASPVLERKIRYSGPLKINLGLEHASDRNWYHCAVTIDGKLTPKYKVVVGHPLSGAGPSYAPEAFDSAARAALGFMAAVAEGGVEVFEDETAANIEAAEAMHEMAYTDDEGGEYLITRKSNKVKPKYQSKEGAFGKKWRASAISQLGAIRPAPVRSNRT